MNETLREEALPKILTPRDLLEEFRSVGHLVAEDGRARNLEGLFHRVDKRGRSVMVGGTKEGPRRSSIWHFRVYPQYDEDDQLIGARFEAHELGGLERGESMQAHTFEEVERLAGEGGFKLIHPPRHKDEKEISPAVSRPRVRDLHLDAQRKAERETTAKALRALSADLVTNRLRIDRGESGEDALAPSITDAVVVNEIVRSSRLPLEEKRYAALRSKQERPGAGAFYLMRSEEMLQIPGKVITDPKEAKTVPTLIVRVRGEDQHMEPDMLVPTYLSAKRDEDPTLSPREQHYHAIAVEQAYLADRASLYALASLRHQIENLQTDREPELLATLRKQGFEQVKLEFEEFRDRSGLLYKMIVPVSTVQIKV